MNKQEQQQWPRDLTPALRDILGFMCFRAGPIAHVYQAAGLFLDSDGCEMPTHAEDEQAFILHRFLTHWFEHGEEWRVAMSKEMEEVVAKAKASAKAATT